MAIFWLSFYERKAERPKSSCQQAGTISHLCNNTWNKYRMQPKTRFLAISLDFSFLERYEEPQNFAKGELLLPNLAAT
jgi:hypothetical protein